MYVCICNSVTDRDVQLAVEAGVGSVKELCRELGITISCPSCARCLRRHLAEVPATGLASAACLPLTPTAATA